MHSGPVAERTTPDRPMLGRQSTEGKCPRLGGRRRIAHPSGGAPFWLVRSGGGTRNTRLLRRVQRPCRTVACRPRIACGMRTRAKSAGFSELPQNYVPGGCASPPAKRACGVQPLGNRQVRRIRGARWNRPRSAAWPLLAYVRGTTGRPPNCDPRARRTWALLRSCLGPPKELPVWTLPRLSPSM